MKTTSVMKTNQNCTQINQARYRDMMLIASWVGFSISLVFQAFGCFVSFFLGSWIKQRLQKDPHRKIYMPYFKPQHAPQAIGLDLVTSNIGHTLIFLGFLSSAVHLVGFLGTMYKNRATLSLFIVLLIAQILIESISIIMVLHHQSPLNTRARSVAMRELERESSASGVENLDSHWVASFYLFTIMMDCCGIDGPLDYRYMFTYKFVPNVCCSQTFVFEQTSELCQADMVAAKVASDDCLEIAAVSHALGNCTRRLESLHNPAYVKQKGCYQALFDTMVSASYWLIPTWIFIFVFRMLTLVVAVCLTGRRFDSVLEKQEISQADTAL